MILRFWGVRGQVPTPGNDFVRYGGNTPCIEIRDSDNQIYALEAGTGIRMLGDFMMGNDLKNGPMEISLLVSDVKWDHTQGLPFFVPSFIPTTVLDTYGPGEEQGDVEMYIAGSMTYSYFPLRLNELRSTRNYFDLEEEKRKIKKMDLETIDLGNAHLALGFSLHLEGKKIAYLPGYEYQTAKEQQKPLKTLKTFCTDCDILIHDAFHLENKDYMEGWARCTFQQAYEFAREVNPKTLIFFGYHPESTDEKLDRKFAEMEKQAASDDVSFELIAAKEGLNLEL